MVSPPIRRHVLALLATALVLPGAGWANLEVPSLPPALQADGIELRPVGGEELTLFGFRVYHASLWTETGRYAGDQAVALNLVYRRGFSRRELARITLQAWEKLGTADPAQRADWATRLQAIWTDVRRGDVLTAVVLPDGRTRFYAADRLLGTLEDPGFGPAFLGIWLDERTQLPDLRTALLGLEARGS